MFAHGRNVAVAVAAALVLGLGLSVQAGVQYRSENGFTVTMPDGWVRIPDSEIQNMMRTMLSGQGQKSVKFEAGFQLPGQPWFSYPYILVQPIPYPNSRAPSTSEMKSAVSQIAGADPKEVTGQLSPEFQRMMATGVASKGQPQFDPDAKTFMWSMRLSVPMIGSVGGICKGHFGDSKLINVNCYAREGEMGKYQADFNNVFASFQFDPSAQYKGAGAPAWMSGAMKGGIIGGAVGALVYGLRKWKQGQ